MACRRSSRSPRCGAGRPAGEDAVGANTELAARLRELHDLPEDTLGYQYVEFYRRNGVEMPGDDANQPAVFVSHEMCCVIAWSA